MRYMVKSWGLPFDRGLIVSFTPLTEWDAAMTKMKWFGVAFDQGRTWTYARVLGFEVSIFDRSF